MKIRFITTNPGKLAEARTRLAPLGVDVVATKKQIVEIQADEIREVARDKALQLKGKVPAPYFLEDAGLHIDALNGFPGVYSSHAFKTIGNHGILKLLRGTPDAARTAHFLAVIALVDGNGRIRLFEGRANGHVVPPRGTQGFGFDPIFQPVGSTETFAELTHEEKGEWSHRGHALDLLADHLGRGRGGKKP